MPTPIPLDPKLIQASLMIRNTPEVQPFVQWLKEEYQRCLVHCMSMPGATVGVAQGRAQQTKFILDQIESASALADKIRGQQ